MDNEQKEKKYIQRCQYITNVDNNNNNDGDERMNETQTTMMITKNIENKK